MKLLNYIANIFTGVWRLCQGLHITMLNFVRPKLTEQYPENRGKHVYFEGFRALLTMPHDDANHHKCTACGICQSVCPNGTITVVGRTEENPETGKPRKALDEYLYDVGSCSFCALCTRNCPFGAIEFSNEFEHSVFTKERLLKRLNHPGSSLAQKPAAPAVPAEPAGNAAPAPETATSASEPAKTAGAAQAAAANPQTL